jgi:PAS domain S-box-containing protein
MPSSTSPRRRRWRFVHRRSLSPDTGDEVARAHRDIQDLKLTEEALRRSQADLAEARRELQLTIDTIPALVVTYDADGRCDFVNRTWQDYTGITLQEARGEGRPDFHPDDIDRVDRAWRASLATGRPFSIELRARGADGPYRWHVIRRVPLRDNAGKITRWYGVGFDIEDRKIAEDALQRSEAELARAERELRLTLDTIPTMAWQTQADGGPGYINKRWLDYTGLSPERALSREWQNTIHPDDRPGLLNAWRAILASGKPADVVARMRRFDGVYRWFLFRPEPFRDESGKLLRWYGTNTDIEDWKLAEAALQRSEAYLAEAQGLSHTGSFGWNVSTGEIFWSEQTFRIFGYEPAATAKMDMVLTRVHPDDRALVERAIDRAATHKEAFDIEHRLQMPDGSVKHLHVVAHALVDEPQALQFAGAVMDITARKETEQALRRSERRYQDMFQAMAVSLWELDYSKAGETLRSLHKSGVVDLGKYFQDNPNATRELLRETRVVDVNDQTVALFGSGNKQELLTSIEPYWPQESWRDYIAAVVSSFGGNKFSTETRLRRLNGTIFDAHMTTWYASEDKTRGLIGIIDITARKQAFAKLEASEQRYRHLFQHMPVALWQLNARGPLELFKQLRSEGVTDLAAYFDAHPGLVQRCMEMLIIEEVNGRTVELLGGRDPSEFVGTSIARYFPKNSPTFRRSMISRYRGDPNYAAETKLFTLDGRVVDVLYTASRVGPISEPGMSLLGVTDITERKRAEEALRRSEQRYQNLFQAMAVAFFELDFSGVGDLLRELRASGVTDFRKHFKENPEVVREFMRATRVVDVNDQTVALFGLGSREGLRDNVEPFWPDESTQAYAEAILSSLERKRSFAVETPLCRVDRSVFDAQFTVWYSPEDPTRGLGGVIDITARKQAFLALEKSERRYQNMFQAMAVAFFEFDFSDAKDVMRELRASGITDLRQHFKQNPETVRQFMRATRIIEVNEHTVALVGRGRREELMGNVEPFWPEESTQAYAEVILSAVERKRSFSIEARFCRVDRSVFDGHFTVWYSTDEPTRGLAGVIDTSERVKAQTMLNEVRADFAHAARVSMLGELTASIAHEVNQPLGAIAAGGEASLRWLARPTPDIDEVRELTKRVVADARRASDVIGRIRAMATRRVPEQALLSLDEVIREALQFLRHEVESRGVAVSHYPAFRPQKVLADRTQLQQVVVNLAINAMQAMAQAASTDRNIIIRTALPDPASVRCSVEDSGPGIEPQHITRLFDSFFTTKDGGMGMGLRICRSVIEAHGGRIAADNESSRGGARFYFTLPVAHIAM